MAQMTKVPSQIIDIENCSLESIRADVLKGTVKITFQTRLNERTIEAQRDLSLLAESSIDLTITGTQYHLSPS